jgi:hypothetical protein
MDYAQNLMIPNLGATQPDDIYFSSGMSVFLGYPAIPQSLYGFGFIHLPGGDRQERLDIKFGVI